jgi:hypothetical protein
VVFFVRDAWRPAHRKQAMLALLLSVPAIVAEGWFYNWFRGW